MATTTHVASSVKYSRLAQSEQDASEATVCADEDEFNGKEEPFGSARLSARKSVEKSASKTSDPHNNDGSVALDPDQDDAEVDEDTLKKRQRSRQASLYSTKLHALIWIVAAASVAYGIDFFHVIFHDPRVSRTYFHVALGCTGVNVCITFYLTIYLRYIKKIMLEWSVYCPRMIPTNTVVGVIGAMCYILAFWNVWGLFTPGILLLLFLGSLMTAHFLPSI